MALVALGLAALSLGQGPIPLLYLCLLLGGACRAFSAPARSALLPQLVPPDALANAVTWNSSGWQVANVAGPALGGLTVALFHYPAAYLLAALCCLASAVLLLPVRPRVIPRPAETRSLASLLAGIRFVWSSELLLAAITLDLFAVLLGGATALLPLYARDILHVGPIELGLLRAAPAVGAFGMAIVLAHRPPLRRAGPALLFAVAGFGLATIVFGFSTHFGLSFIMLVLTGAMDNVSVVVRGTLMQMLTPDEMLGRVAAVNTIFISSSNELGAFESGITAWPLGPVVSVVGGGIGTLAVVLLVMLRWPSLARLGPLHPVPPSTPTQAEAAAAESETPTAAP
jgi:MFS family permease